MKSLKDILFLPPVDNALVTLGKIVVALSAFLGVLRGVISIGEGLFYAYNGTLPQAILAYVIIGGLISAITGYAYYLLLDMENKGRLVSYGRFCARLGGGIFMVLLFPIASIVGLITIVLSKNFYGILLIILGIIVLLIGIGISRFIEERDNFQNPETKLKYSFWYGSRRKAS